MKDINDMMENVEATKENLDLGSQSEIEALDLLFEEEDGENLLNDQKKELVIKCGSNTDPNKLAYCITKEFEQKASCIVIQTIGPKALSKAVFAIINLKAIIAPWIDGCVLVNTFSVRKLQFPDGEERTAVRIRLFTVPNVYSI